MNEQDQKGTQMQFAYKYISQDKEEVTATFYLY